MILLGTPYIGLFSDSETTLLFVCMVLGYTALYYYLMSRELHRKLKKLQNLLDETEHEYGVQGSI